MAPQFPSDADEVRALSANAKLLGDQHADGTHVGYVEAARGADVRTVPELEPAPRFSEPVIALVTVLVGVAAGLQQADGLPAWAQLAILAVLGAGGALGVRSIVKPL